MYMYEEANYIVAIKIALSQIKVNFLVIARYIVI